MKKLLFILFIFTGLVNMAFGQEIFLDENFQKKTFKRPVREFSIIVTDDGFYPNRIMAQQGERIHFFITSTSKTNQCFILQKHEVFVSAEKGLINEAEIVVDVPGRFKFYCPSTKFEGHLTVMKKFGEAPASKIGRGIASESTKPRFWIPRDHD